MRFALLLVLLGLLASPALTASNTIAPAAAGGGAGAISGYAVSSIAYALDGETVDAVSFTLSPPGATTVKARLSPGEPWTTCAVVAATATCAVGTPLAAVSSLDVVAAE